MLNLESVASFVAIADAGSLAAAARRIGVSKSVVSARLADLERALGVRLIRRTTRALALTQEGNSFYRRAKQILRDIDQAAAEVTAQQHTLTGPLRISAPVGFGNLHLGPALFGFLVQNPGIDLTLDVDDRFVDVVREGYDAVIRHGPVEDQRLIVKRLASSRRILVASPDYLKRFGTPGSVGELKTHRGVIYSNRGDVDWRFRVGRGWINVTPQTALRVNNGLLMRDAAVAGLGIALLPTFFLASTLKGGSLIAVDVGAAAEGGVIHVAYPEDLRESPKIEALIGWLRRAFGDPPYWDASSGLRGL
jgi:DNA-binding transcriptional LysR family regulator